MTFNAALPSGFSRYSATSPLSSASCLYSPALPKNVFGEFSGGGGGGRGGGEGSTVKEGDL
jgi:hypothetical protein